MNFYPNDLRETLEFDKLLFYIQQYCFGDSGIAFFENQPFMTKAADIRRSLSEAHEFKMMLSQNRRFPLSRYEDLSEDLKMLVIDGYVLSLQALQAMSGQLRIARDIYRFFKVHPDTQALYPNLFKIIGDTNFEEGLLPMIEKVIDIEGNVRPDASPELTRLHRALMSRRKDLEREFRNIINRYSSKGWLADNIETIRNGRRVLSVMAENKRNVRGIIHDESDTGKTTFIEPEEVIDINNDIFDIENEQKREVYRILRDLSATLRPYTKYFQLYQDIIIRFDTIQAKGNFAYRFNCIEPEVSDTQTFLVRKAYHPLLLIKNGNEGKKTVPCDLTLLHDNRIILISGPNAGGKSVTMKAAGLIQLMFQFGLLIPAEEGAKMSVFDKMFGDIGDQQSLEDELSTYSSRLKNAYYFLENADSKTFVLIDEFGSGTDPKAGGAIAETILAELNKKEVWGVITTHYSNLKLYAFHHKGIVNAAMVFDKETLSPTYQLRIGKPGSSYAFEIARKTGFSQQLMDASAKRMGEAEKNLDELLINLQHEKEETLETRIALLEERQKLDKLIRQYEALTHDAEIARKKIKLTAKQQTFSVLQESGREIQTLLKELRSREQQEDKIAAKKAVEEARLLQEKQKELFQQAEKELHEEADSLNIKLEKVAPKKITVGCEVRVTQGGALGLVESINKKEAVVILGGKVRLTLPLRDLEALAEPEPVQKTVIKFDFNKNFGFFDHKLDIRGMRYEEALTTIEDFMDRALMTNANILHIIHGKGTGVLRQAVRQKLRSYRDVSDVRNAEDNQGGDGVTVVELG